MLLGLFLCYTVWTQAFSPQLNDYDCAIVTLPDGTSSFVCRLKDQQQQSEQQPSEDENESLMELLPHEDSLELYRLRHASSIARQVNCDRILLQFLKLSDVRDSTCSLDMAAATEDVDFVSSLTQFAELLEE